MWWVTSRICHEWQLFKVHYQKEMIIGAIEKKMKTQINANKREFLSRCYYSAISGCI